MMLRVAHRRSLRALLFAGQYSDRKRIGRVLDKE